MSDGEKLDALMDLTRQLIYKMQEEVERRREETAERQRLFCSLSQTTYRPDCTVGWPGDAAGYYRDGDGQSERKVEFGHGEAGYGGIRPTG